MLLLIPGPVTTHDAVRAAAARDYAPWDNEFRDLVVRVRRRVPALAGGRESEHASLPPTGQCADRLGRLATEAGPKARGVHARNAA